MALNWQDVIISAFTTVGVGAVFLGAAAWLLKAVITDRLRANADAEIERVRSALTQQTEAFKIRLKADSDVSIERTKSALEILKEREVSSYKGKTELYRALVKPVADLLVNAAYSPTPPDLRAFEAERVRLWCELAMFTSEEAVTAFMGVSEYLASTLAKGARPDWRETRRLALPVINAVRRDLQVATNDLALEFKDW